MIYSDSYKGQEAYILENDSLKLMILKELGGKVASIKYKQQDFEVLFQPTKDKYELPSYGDAFEKYDTSGIDEMYPTIDKCVYPFDTIYKGIEMPDHGELWSEAWNFDIEGEVLKSWFVSPRFEYIFVRNFVLDANKIKLFYEVINIGKEIHYGIWAFHGLLACDEKSKILLNNVNEIVNVHNSNFLGKAGTLHKYPVTLDSRGKEYLLDKVNPRAANKTEKYYVNGRLKKGEAGITLNNNKLQLNFDFPKEKVPYLGVWINEGGFKGEYNCAIEPSNGFYDSLTIAKERNKVQAIKPFEKISWYLNLTLEEID